LSSKSFSPLAFTVKVVLAQNPDWAGVIGAAILAQEKEIAH
jgi:activator of 2-hydroxyglutaryl-CoA dehydratase